MNGKPKKLVKSCELSSLNGVTEVSFGKSTAEARMRGDYSKNPKEHATREYADVTERHKRYGLV